LRGAKQPHTGADGERAFDHREQGRRPVQPLFQDVRAIAGEMNCEQKHQDRHGREQRSSAAPASDPVGHGVKPAALGCDDTQAEHRQVLRPLPA